MGARSSLFGDDAPGLRFNDNDHNGDGGAGGNGHSYSHEMEMILEQENDRRAEAFGEKVKAMREVRATTTCCNAAICGTLSAPNADAVIDVHRGADLRGDSHSDHTQQQHHRQSGTCERLESSVVVVALLTTRSCRYRHRGSTPTCTERRSRSATPWISSRTCIPPRRQSTCAT